MREKLLLLLTLFFLIGITTTSCSDDTPPKGGPGDQSFRLSYTIPAPTQVITRSVPTEEGEDQVNSFYILFFENTTGGTGKFIAAIDVMETHPGPLSNTGVVDIEFPTGSGLNATGTYNMLLCANIEAYKTGVTNLAGLEAFCHDRTENEVIGLLQAKIEGVPSNLSPAAEQEDNTRRMDLTNLPMSTSAVKQAGENELTVELTRTVSRFDVSLDQSVEGYELASASIWNAYTVSRIWEGVFSEFTDDRTQRYYGVKVNNNKEITGSLYAFENFVSSPAQNDKATTCLIIGLRNKNNNDKIEYFRANVNATSSIGHQLHRNHVYTLVIKGVTSEGEDNERDAYGNSDFLLDIDINGWKIDDSGTIQIEGPDVLATPTATARLFAQGETREYYVYTIGEGVPEITRRNLPEGIKATLTLAPGYSASANFKTSILTFEAAPGKTGNNHYNIEISFSTMHASIAVEQVEGNAQFIDLEPYQDVITLGFLDGSLSERITVNSSGTWVAKIIHGDHLSLNPGSGTMIEGSPGGWFSIHVIETNPTDEPRYWFVSVYLKENPEIVRNLVVVQRGREPYVEFKIDQTTVSSTATSVPFEIRSNSYWDAEIVIEEGTKAGFNPDYTSHKIENQLGNTFPTIYMPANYSNTPTQVIVKATVRGTDISSELLITQPAYYTGTLFLTNASSIGNLSLVNSNNYNYYVYNLGEKMRDNRLFGSQGSIVEMESGDFSFVSGVTVTDLVKEANIVQMVSNFPTTLAGIVYEQMQDNPYKLLMITDNTTVASTMLANFNTKASAGYGSITSLGIPAATNRVFYSGDKSEHPLLQYLLNGVVDPEEIALKGYNSANVGLAENAWAPTFVPIIMSGGKCVFGIDPVHRLILMTDPAIFGGNNPSYRNYANFADPDSANSKFLTNFVTWMARVTTEGESFLEQFQ